LTTPSPQRPRTFTFAQTVQINGVVEGNVYVFAESLDVAPGARITGTLFASGDTLDIAPGARIDGSVFAAAGSLHVRGSIGGALRFGGNRLTVDPAARIHGPISAEVDDPALVHAPAGSSIHADRDRFADPAWYLLKLAAILAAFVIAWLADRLFPSFLYRASRAAENWWRSLGAGILAALAIPLALLIGLPLAAALATIYTAAIYGAKILIAGLAGRSLLPAARSIPRLAAGLALVFTACELPFGIGVAAWLAVSLVGLGAFASALRAARQPA
jgi:cytoskeletal protein CcmA (bactofilin family)